MKKLFTSSLFVLGVGLFSSAFATPASLDLAKYQVYTSANTSGTNYTLYLNQDGKATYVLRNEDEGASYVQQGSWSHEGDAVTLHVESPLAGKDLTIKFVAMATLAKPGASEAENGCSYPSGLKAVSVNGAPEKAEQFYFWPYELLTPDGVPCK